MVSLQPKTDLNHAQAVRVNPSIWVSQQSEFLGLLDHMTSVLQKEKMNLVVYFKTRFCHIAQAGLNFASAFWELQFSGMQHHTQSETEYLVPPLPNELLYWYCGEGCTEERLSQLQQTRNNKMPQTRNLNIRYQYLYSSKGQKSKNKVQQDWFSLRSLHLACISCYLAPSSHSHVFVPLDSYLTKNTRLE